MDALDTELLGLISRLNKIQKEVGGGEKKVIHQLSGGKVDRFLDLCDSMNERLEIIKNAIDEIKKLEKTPGANPTELISNQSKVRSELNQLNDEWKELDMLFRIESKKKRSRHTPEELTARKDMVLQLQNAINNIKDMQRSGFVKEYQGARMATMEESEMFQKKELQTGAMRPDGTAVTTPARGIGQRNNYMTEDHKQRLMLIKERDQRIVCSLCFYLFIFIIFSYDLILCFALLCFVCLFLIVLG